ncbi:uncharacterized protein Dwil_GK10854 [Drosophila willistoni]|uniref:TraB n=1 Tax=Drosophila willistoni TaxID=7260 RepID=B4N9Y4_DROWI|nr:traB domain-containing protein [Drosophila willistoni]EDW81739.1 uncharacterized protein Dwil_GK10854 [Drosophila willistoni]
MDLTPSASSSFESACDNESKLSNSLIGDGDGANGTLYDSALDQLSTTTTYKSCDDITISDLNHSSMSPKPAQIISPIDLNAAPNGNLYTSPTPAINASMLLIQSESTDTNTSQEEVDPKSQLANKTIFKSHNPDLSIIEINDNSIKEQDLEKEVVLIEGEEVKSILKKSPIKAPATSTTTTTAATTAPETVQAEKRRRKTESLLQSSKQKLDISIAEASAAADGGDGTLVSVNDQPQTKRDINIYNTLEEFEQHLPPTVTVLNTPFGSKVYLVGTAHFSEESQDDVSFVIRNVRPDVVMVELCPSRIHILKLDEKTLLEEAKNINIPKIRGILQTHGYINGIFFILLLQMSAQIAKDLGMAPGGEFRRAFEEIRKLPGCILHLGDRPIRITLYRALRALSLWQTMKLVWRLTFTDSISIEEVEECKQRDLLEKLMQEMAGEFPAFSDVFVRERDLFLCHSLQLAALPQAAPGATQVRPVRVVGVVGIGHANGIAKMWGHVDPEKIPSILEIPPASLGQRVCKYTIKYSLIGLGCYAAFRFMRPRLTRLF